MNWFFSGENPFFRFTGRVLDVIVLSLLWFVCCLPVVTILPATSALYYSCVKCIRYREPGPYGSFFSSFRENLRTGAGAMVVFLIVAAVLWLVYHGVQMGFPGTDTKAVVIRYAYLVLMLLPVGWFSCAAALLSRFSYSAMVLLGNSARVAMGNLLRILPAAIVSAAVVLLSLQYFYLLVWLLLPALGALLASLFLEPVLRKYTPLDEWEDVEPEKRPWYLR